MRSLIRFAIALSLLGFLVGVHPDVFAFPPLPSSFYGTVKLDGQNAQVGTIIQARINDTVFASTEVQLYDGNVVYSLIVPGDDPASPSVEGGVVGDIIQFQIGAVLADQTAVWQSGVNLYLNLTAEGEVSLPTSTPTPSPTPTPIPTSPTFPHALTSTLTPTGVFPSATQQIAFSITYTSIASQTTTKVKYSITPGISPEQEAREKTNDSIPQVTQVVGKEVQTIYEHSSSSMTLTPTSNRILESISKIPDSNEPEDERKAESWLYFGVPAVLLSIIGFIFWIFHREKGSDQQLL